MTDTSKIFRKLSNALNANDTEAARKIIENDLKRIGAWKEYYFYLALLTDNKKEKLELYTKSIESDPGFSDAYINRGLVKNELDDLDGSIEDYDKAIELDSTCALAYNNRGYSKYRKQDYKGALEDYNKAILLNPILKIAMDNKAKLLMNVCMKDDSDFSEKYYLSLGIYDFNRGKLDDAENSFNEILKYNPVSSMAYFYKGVICHTRGDEDNGIKNYTKAIELNKKMTDAYFNRGQILLKTDLKAALDDFVTAVALDSKFIDAYYSIAAIQKKLGEYENAIKNLDKIIEIEPHAVNAKALKKLILTKYLNKN